MYPSAGSYALYFCICTVKFTLAYIPASLLCVGNLGSVKAATCFGVVRWRLLTFSWLAAALLLLMDSTEGHPSLERGVARAKEWRFREEEEEDAGQGSQQRFLEARKCHESLGQLLHPHLLIHSVQAFRTV